MIGWKAQRLCQVIPTLHPNQSEHHLTALSFTFSLSHSLSLNHIFFPLVLNPFLTFVRYLSLLTPTPPLIQRTTDLWSYLIWWTIFLLFIRSDDKNKNWETFQWFYYFSNYCLNVGNDERIDIWSQMGLDLSRDPIWRKKRSLIRPFIH